MTETIKMTKDSDTRGVWGYRSQTRVKKLWVEPEDREVPERSSNVSFLAVSHVRGKDG
jgi:hypothetical protein